MTTTGGGEGDGAGESEAAAQLVGMEAECDEPEDAASLPSLIDILVAAAQEEEAEEDEDLPPASEVLLSRGILLSSTSTQHTGALPTRTARSTPSYRRIKLQQLFNYSVDSREKDGLKFYWDVGQILVDREARVLELAQQSN